MTVWLHLLQLHGISVINFIIMNMLLGIFGCGIFGWRHFILYLLYICILFNVIFGWRYFFVCTAKFVVVISIIIDTFKQT